MTLLKAKLVDMPEPPVRVPPHGVLSSRTRNRREDAPPQLGLKRRGQRTSEPATVNLVDKGEASDKEAPLQRRK